MHSLQRRRICQLLGLVGLLAAVVVALVIVLATRNDNSGNKGLEPSVPTVPPFSGRCSFCAGGAQPSISLDQLRNIRITSNPFPTCADLYIYQQSLPSTDSSCPVLQAFAFYYSCGCQTPPPRPENATCTACSNGTIATGTSRCAKVDAFVAVVGSSLFYYANCGTLAYDELNKNGCTCSNGTSSRQV